MVHPPTGLRAHLPDWYLGVVGLLFGLFVAVSAFYWLGAEGVSFNGAGGINFKRQHDFALLELTPSHALMVQESGYVAVVTFDRGPWCWLMCGTYEPTGTAGDAITSQGDWVYWAPKKAGDVAVNLATGERVSVTDTSSRSELAAKGLTFSPGGTLDQSQVLPKLKSLSVQNESCTTFTSAFLILFVVALLALPFVARAHRKRLLSA